MFLSNAKNVKGGGNSQSKIKEVRDGEIGGMSQIYELVEVSCVVKLESLKKQLVMCTAVKCSL